MEDTSTNIPTERLTRELENDKSARDYLREDNKRLLADIKKYEKELFMLQKEGPDSKNAMHMDCQGYRTFLELRAAKEQLKSQLSGEKERLKKLRDRNDLLRAKYLWIAEANTDIVYMNMDSLSQPEIIRVTKQLERRKIDVQSKLHEIENSLDSTAKICRLKRGFLRFLDGVDFSRIERKMAPSPTEK